MNILLLLTPKVKLAYLDDKMTVRQALEKMKAHGYSAIPMISKKDGTYIGSLSEGDFLWHIMPEGKSIEELEDEKAITLLRKDFMPAVSNTEEFRNVLRSVLNQNYVPVVDDRNVLVGIVTRKAVISYCMDEINRMGLGQKEEAN